MFKFKVTPDEGEAYEVVSNTRDILKWEKTTKGASASDLEKPTMQALYKIAFLAAQRSGQFTGTLQQFEESCDLEVTSDEEPDPTRSEATAAAS